MKKILGVLFINLIFFCGALKSQVTAEAFPMDPQSGSHNYFGVRVTLAQTYTENITVTGYIYDMGGGANTNNPFSLTVTAGNLTAETAANFYQTDPTAPAEAMLGTIATVYAGVTITYEADGCILKFNSLADADAVLNQLEADDDNYNDDYDSQYPNATEDELDDLDEQNNFDNMKVYRDFEALFGGFCSKRSELEEIENTWLSNNFNGTDPDDIDLTFDDAENTIFNSSYSFKIGTDVYQLTSTGMYKNGVLQDEGGSSLNHKPNNFIELPKYGILSGPLSSPNYDGSFANLPTANALTYNFFTVCKSNKKDKIFQEYDNGNKRVKATVSITSTVIRNGVHGKIKNFKSKNGNWKRSRAQLAVYCFGTYYTNLCADSHQFTDRKPLSGTKKRVKISTRRHSPGHIPVQGTVWKTFTGEVAMYGEVGGSVQGQLTLTF